MGTCSTERSKLLQQLRRQQLALAALALLLPATLALLVQLSSRPLGGGPGLPLLNRRAPGLIGPTSWHLALGAEQFCADAFELARLHVGEPVRLRVAARSRVLLDVLPDVPTLAPATDVPAPALSARERRLLQLLQQGRADKLIARELGLSPGTVRTYNSALFRKLGVSDRDAAVQWARAHPHLLLSIDAD